MKQPAASNRAMALGIKDPLPFSPHWSRTVAGEASIISVAWSPAGPTLPAGCAVFIASAGPANSINVWDAEQDEAKKLLVTYRGHRAEITAMVWSNDGSRIASASEDHAVHIWDARSGATIMAYQSSSYGIRALAWSPHGDALVVGGDDNIIQVLDSAQARPRLTYHGHARARYGIDAVAWSPDGQRIASSGDDNTVQVWDATTGEVFLTYRGHSESWALAVAWSPDGNWLASGGDDVQVWHARTGEHVQSYHGHALKEHWIDCVAWSPDGQCIASSSSDMALHTWHAFSGADIQTYTHTIEHSEFVAGLRANALAWSPEAPDYKRCVAFASYDGSVSLCYVDEP